MRQAVDDKLRMLARVMRKNATNAERRMWSKHRDGRLGGLKFRRQAPIGRAIADFVCYGHKLIVAVDGGQHSENRRDVVRDAELSRTGFHVLSFLEHRRDAKHGGGFGDDPRCSERDDG
jgi:very-short-patch-repair endonuclease